MRNKKKYRYTVVTVNNLLEIDILQNKVLRELTMVGKIISITSEIAFLKNLIGRGDITVPYIFIYKNFEDRFVAMIHEYFDKSPYSDSDNYNDIQTVHNISLFKHVISYKSKKLLP